MKKLILILILIAAITTPVVGQPLYSKSQQPDHLMWHITGSASQLQYQSAEGSSKPAPVAGVGVEYAHFFQRSIGLSAGVELNSYAAFYTFDGRSDSLQMFDSWSSYHYKLRQQLYTKEYQRVSYVSFPVKVILRQRLSRTINLNLSSGLAWNVYLTEKKSIVAGTIHRQAYFDDIHVNVDEFYPLMFGQFTDYINPSPQKQFGTTLTFVAQAGLSFQLNTKWALHTELNFQSGLKDIKERHIDLLVPEEYAGVTATNYIGEIKPHSLGLRIGFTYSFDLFDKDCRCHGNWWE